MAESLGSNSEICNISVYFDSILAAGTEISIRNSNGEIIMSHTAAKSFSHMAVGSEEFVLGETYTIYLNDDEYDSFTVLEVTTTLGSGGPGRDMAPPEKRKSL